MKQPSASPSAKKLMKFYRRENSVGVIRIKLTESELAELQAAYQTAASVPFKMETIFLDHQTVQCGDRNPDTNLETRIRSSHKYGKSTLENDTEVTVRSAIENRNSKKPR